MKRAADATGVRALEPVVSEILSRTSDPSISAAYKLIGIEIALTVNPDPPVEAIRSLARELKGNHYALRVFQHLVVSYLHVNYVPVATTQKLCAALNIASPPKSLSDSARKLLPRPQ